MTMRSWGKFFANMSRLEAHDETGSPAVEFALVFPAQRAPICCWIRGPSTVAHLASISRTWATAKC
jgi:hypothetical protein